MTYIYKPHYAWVEWTDELDRGPDGELMTDQWGNPLPRFDGFSVELLINPNGKQVSELQRTWADFLRGERSIDDLFQVIAPRIRAWTFEREDDSGAIVTVPAPGEHPDNWEGLNLLEGALMRWLIDQVRRAHLPKLQKPPAPDPQGAAAEPATVPAAALEQMAPAMVADDL